MTRIVVLFLILLLAGCSEPLDLELETEVSVFLTGDGKEKITLRQQDEAYSELDRWLADNSSGWYVTSGRYRGGVYVQSGNHGIQITDKHVVIYSTAGSEARAMYIQSIADDELRNVRSLGN